MLVAFSFSPYVSSTLSTLKAVETVLPQRTSRCPSGPSYILGRGQTLRREREGETIDDKLMFVKMKLFAVRCTDTVFTASLVLRISPLPTPIGFLPRIRCGLRAPEGNL